MTFPFNFLIYAWNDSADRALDELNPRKDSYLFGARASSAPSRATLAAVALVQFPFACYFLVKLGPVFLGWMTALLTLNAAYNCPPLRLSGRPPWGLLSSLGYLLVADLSVRLNARPPLPLPTFLYIGLFAVQGQLIGEILDIIPDRLAGRSTVSTVLGFRRAKMLLLAIVEAEIALLLGYFNDMVLASILSGFALYLVLDAFLLFGERPYTLPQMRAAAFAANAAALATMLWVWMTGSLTAPR